MFHLHQKVCAYFTFINFNELEKFYYRSRKCAFGYMEIVEKFKAALESYERFSFAAWIEYECMMKAASVFRYQRLYIDMEVVNLFQFSNVLD